MHVHSSAGVVESRSRPEPHRLIRSMLIRWVQGLASRARVSLLIACAGLLVASSAAAIPFPFAHELSLHCGRWAPGWWKLICFVDPVGFSGLEVTAEYSTSTLQYDGSVFVPPFDASNSFVAEPSTGTLVAVLDISPGYVTEPQDVVGFVFDCPQEPEEQTTFRVELTAGTLYYDDGSSVAATMPSPFYGVCPLPPDPIPVMRGWAIVILGFGFVGVAGFVIRGRFMGST